MKEDSGTYRVSNAFSKLTKKIKYLNNTIESNLTLPGSSFLNLSDYYSIPPSCLACINIDSINFTEKCRIEKFMLPNNLVLLLHSLAIISKDEFFLNSAIVGKTSPDPSYCNIQVWATNLQDVKGKYVSLEAVRNNTNSIFFMSGFSDLVTNSIIFKGIFNTLTICFIGWKINVGSDIRISLGNVYTQASFSNRIGRSSASPNCFEICPADEYKFRNLKKKIAPKEINHFCDKSKKNRYVKDSSIGMCHKVDGHSDQCLTVIDSENNYIVYNEYHSKYKPISCFFPDINCQKQSLLLCESNKTLIQLYLKNLKESRFHQLLHDVVNGSPLNYDSELKIKLGREFPEINIVVIELPEVEYIREIATDIVYHLTSFHDTFNLIRCQDFVKSNRECYQIQQEFFSVIKTWKWFLTIFFSPLYHSKSYEELLFYLTKTHLKLKNGDLFTSSVLFLNDLMSYEIDKTEPIVIVNSLSITVNQMSIMFQTLEVALRNSSVILDLFLMINGPYSIFHFTSCVVVKNTSNYPLFPVYPSKINVVVLRILENLTKCRKGIIFLLKKVSTILENNFELSSGHFSKKTSTDNCTRDDSNLNNYGNDSSKNDCKYVIGSNINCNSSISNEFIRKNLCSEINFSSVSLISLYDLLIASFVNSKKLFRTRYYSIFSQIRSNISFHLSIEAFQTQMKLFESSKFPNPEDIVTFLRSLSFVVFHAVDDKVYCVSKSTEDNTETELVFHSTQKPTEIEENELYESDSLGTDTHSCVREEKHEYLVDRFLKQIPDNSFIHQLVNVFYELQNSREKLFFNGEILNLDTWIMNSGSYLSNKRRFEKSILDNVVDVDNIINWPYSRNQYTSSLSCALSLLYMFLNWIFTSSRGFLFLLNQQHVKINEIKPKNEYIDNSQKTTTKIDLQNSLSDNLPKWSLSLFPTIKKKNEAYWIVFNFLNAYSNMLQSFDSNDNNLKRETDKVHYPENVFFSWNAIEQLSNFVSDPENSDDVMLLWGNHLLLAESLSFLLSFLTITQSDFEKQTIADNEKTNNSEIFFLIQQRKEFLKKHFVDFHFCAARVAALRYVIHILFSLFLSKHSTNFITTISETCLTPLFVLSHFVKDNSTFKKNENISSLSRHDVKSSCESNDFFLHFKSSKCHWSKLDLTLNAYSNLDSIDSSTSLDKKSLNILNYLVPSTLSTSLHEVFANDTDLSKHTVILWQVTQMAVDIIKLNSKDSEVIENKYVHSNKELDNKLISEVFQPSIVELLKLDSKVSESNNDLSPHTAKIVEYLVDCIESISNSMPSCYSVSSCQQIMSSRKLNMANHTFNNYLHLGGYNGVQGINIKDLQASTQGYEPSNTTSDVKNVHVQNCAPKNVLLKMTQLLFCFRFLLKKIYSEKSMNFDDTIKSGIDKDSITELLVTDILNPVTYTLQSKQQTIRVALTNLLYHCGNYLVPSIAPELNSNVLTRVEGVNAYEWESSLFDVLLITHEKKGMSWVSGSLIDSSFMEVLFLLLNKLCHAWIFIINPFSSTSLDGNIQDSIKSNNSNSTKINICKERIKSCFDYIGYIFQLWGVRCPDSCTLLLKSAIRQGRVNPVNFFVAPFLLVALQGFGLILPNTSGSFSFEKTQPSLMAQELNGAEGRNFDAVILRLKQLSLRERHHESVKSNEGLGAEPAFQTTSSISRLPSTITTLTLSASLTLPCIFKKNLFQTDTDIYLILKIPLLHTSRTQPLFSLEVLPFSINKPLWTQRKLGRLSMGDEGEMCSFSIFQPEFFSNIKKKDHKSYINYIENTCFSEWSSWENVENVLRQSLEDDGIEESYKSDSAPLFDFGLSPACVRQLTALDPLTNDMTKELHDESLNIEKSQLSTLKMVNNSLKNIKIEDLSELFSQLILSSYSTNPLLVAFLCYNLSLFSWSNGLPVLDTIVSNTKLSIQKLSLFLSDNLVEKTSLAITHLFSLCRLCLIIDYSFNLFCLPSLETSNCLIHLVADCLKALQDIPIVDNNSCTNLILFIFFDCLLPSCTRLFKTAIVTFFDFLNLIKEDSEVHIKVGLLSLAKDSLTETNSTKPLSKSANKVKKNTSSYVNHNLLDQFPFFFKRSKTKSNPSDTLTQASKSISIPVNQDIITGFISKIRFCCKAFTNILNQLPIVWDVNERTNIKFDNSTLSDIPHIWGGLSLSVVKEILYVLALTVQNKFLRVVTLFDIPDSFLEIYLNNVYLTTRTNTQSVDKSTFLTSPNIEDISIGATPNPSICLGQFISSLIDLSGNININSSKSELFNRLESNEYYSTLKNTTAIIKYLIEIVSKLVLSSDICRSCIVLSVGLTEDELRVCLSKNFDFEDMSDDCIALYGGHYDHNENNFNGNISSSNSYQNIDFTRVKDILLKDLLLSINKLKTQLMNISDENPNRITELIESFNDFDIHIETISKFIKENIRFDKPGLILHGENFFDIPTEEIKTYHTETRQYFVFHKDLYSFVDWSFKTEIKSPFSPSVYFAMLNFSETISKDSLWNNCKCLNSSVIKVLNWNHVSNTPEDMCLLEKEDKNNLHVLCLPYVLLKDIIDESVFSSGSIINNIECKNKDSFTSTSDTSSIKNDQNQWKKLVSQSTSLPKVYQHDAVGNDHFRCRRGPSSRAPSKHVDEFIALQSKNKQNDTTATNESVTPNLSEESSLNIDFPLGNTSLDSIPQWREFVANGVEQGLDIMSILHNPQLLQDSEIEKRFRSLIELHPIIKTLFTMMESDSSL